MTEWIRLTGNKSVVPIAVPVLGDTRRFESCRANPFGDKNRKSAGNTRLLPTIEVIPSGVLLFLSGNTVRAFDGEWEQKI